MRYLAFAAGMVGGRVGSGEVGEEGSQRSGMKLQGSGKRVSEWCMRGWCIEIAVCEGC